MSQLINSGKISEVKSAISKCNSRAQLRLALESEKKNKQRSTVIALLEEALKS